MAYQKDWRDDEQQPGTAANPAAAKQNTSGVIDGQTSPDTATTSGAAKPIADPTAASQQGTGSGFVNLQAYMDGNKGEGGRMVNDATKGLSADAAGFQGTADKTVADSTKAMNGAAGNDKIPGLQKGLTADAAGNAGAAADFVHSGYGGATAADADAGLAAQQKDLASKLGAVSGDTSVAALKEKAGAPYTSGFGYLDKFLMGDKSGQDAINAVHAKAGVVNAQGDIAKAQLGSAEATARAKLAANQAAVKQAAFERQNDISNAGLIKLAGMNKGVDHNNYTGAVDHSLGGALSDKDRQDLEALNAITGGNSNASWYGDTYNQGTAKPIDTDSSQIPINPYQDWQSGHGSGNDGGASGGINKFVGDQKDHGKSLGDSILTTAQTPSAQNIADTSVQAFEQPAQSLGALDTATKQALGSAIPTAPTPSGPAIKAPSLKKKKFHL